MNNIKYEDNFDEIYKSYTDPQEIKKRLSLKKKEKIAEEKQTIFCLNE